MTISEHRFLVIYFYQEFKNCQKSQTNLSFFIRHAMNVKNWKILNIDYLFIYDNCEVLIPILPNISIINTKSTNNFEVWNEGINYVKNKSFLTNINLKYDYIFFMNSEIYGPFIDKNINGHWLEPYYDKIYAENTILCSNIISFLPNTDLGGPGLRCSTYNFLLKLDDNIMTILQNVKVKAVEIKQCTNTDKNNYNYENTVFGKKISQTDNILTGEYGLSKLLLKYRYRISCLLYNYDEYIKNTNLNNCLQQDRHLTYKPTKEGEVQNLPVEKIIFFKNVWKSEEIRICLPVQYNICKNIDLEYSNIKILDSNNDDSNNDDYINCSENLYKLYGYAEEIITFPKQKINNKSVAIYHHYDFDNIIKDHVIQALKCLIASRYDIYFCTSCEKIINVDLPFEVHYYPNYGAGTDFIVYYEVIKNNLNKFKEKYEWIFITNDSVIFPINGVDHFQSVVNKNRSISDFWGHWSSVQVCHHLIGTILELKINMIDDLNIFLTNKMSDYKTVQKNKDYYIFEVEVKLLNYFLSLGYKHHQVIYHDKYNYFEGKYKSPFEPFNFYKWLNDPDVFAIKWKYMANYMNLEYINKPYLNFLMRYVHFGPNGPPGNYQTSTSDDPHISYEKYKL